MTMTKLTFVVFSLCGTLLPTSDAQCRSSSPTEWFPDGNSYVPFAGSNVDLTMRHGFHPTKVTFPDVVKDVDGTKQQPRIDLTTARASQPFMEVFEWNNPRCGFRFEGDAKSDITTTDMLEMTANALYNGNGIPYGAGFVVNRNLEREIALSTPNWNNSYYTNVLPDLIEMGTNGSGCVRPQTVTNTQDSGKGFISLDQFSNLTCYSFFPDFLAAFAALPIDLGDALDYIDFCETFGWYYPSKFNINQVSTSLNVKSESADLTKFLFGQFGQAIYATESECLDAMPGSLQLNGWNFIGDYVEGNFTQISQNFVDFYQTYPISNQPSPGVDALWEEQLFTYAPPPNTACSRIPAPTPSPTPSLTSSTWIVGSIVLQEIMEDIGSTNIFNFCVLSNFRSSYKIIIIYMESRHGGMTKSPHVPHRQEIDHGVGWCHNGGVRVGSFCSKISLTWAGCKVPFPTDTRHATIFRTCRYKKLLPFTTMANDDRGGGCDIS
eukprot:scaffold75198_cov55-Attheya_sp.AAC.1